ncbi:MAG: hypothetical protein QXY05_02460 [Candidatus Anstonellales archaeon]
MKRFLAILLGIVIVASGLFFAVSCNDKVETVTLEVTVPGFSTGSQHNFDLLIADWMDKRLENRAFNNSLDLYTYKRGLLNKRASPYQNQINGWLAEFDALDYSNVDGNGGVAAYRISGNNFVPFSKIFILSDLPGGAWDESQFAWFSGYSEMGYSNYEVAPTITSGVYSLVFGPDMHGLPLCPGEPGTSYWECNECNDRIENSHMQIKFLGSTWVISDVYPPTGATQVEDKEVFTEDGTMIVLSKEESWGILYQKECLTYTQMGVRVCLDNISSLEPCRPAIVSFTDLLGNPIYGDNGQPIKDQIRPGETKIIFLPGYGDIRVHCYRTYYSGIFQDTRNRSWAELGVYSDEIKLAHDKKFNKNDETAWNVLLGWTVENGGNADEADYIKEITLYNSEPMEKMLEGEEYPLIDVPPYNTYHLVYDGLEPAEFDTVRMEYQERYNRSFYITGSGGTSPACTAGQTLVLAPSELIVVSSEKDEFNEPSTTYGSRMYVIGSFSEGYGCTGSPKPGDLILEDSHGNYWYVGYPSDVSVGNTHLEYAYAGDEGNVVVYGPSQSWSGNVEVWLSEDIGSWDNSPGSECKLVDAVGVKEDPINKKLLSVFTGQDNKVSYIIAEDGADPLGTDVHLVGPPFGVLQWQSDSDYATNFITLRGSYAKNTGYRRWIEVSDIIRHAEFNFTIYPQDQLPDVFICDKIPEGQVCNVGGVSILVMSIDQFFKSCGFDPAEIQPAPKENEQKITVNKTTKIKIDGQSYEIPSQITVSKN